LVSLEAAVDRPHSGDKNSLCLNLIFFPQPLTENRGFMAAERNRVDILMGQLIDYCQSQPVPLKNEDLQHRFALALDRQGRAAAYLMDELNRLPRRRFEVAQLVAAGYSTKRVGHSLGIAQSSVKTHVSALLRTFGLRSRIEFVALLANHRIKLPLQRTSRFRSFTDEMPQQQRAQQQASY
jgi:DNA-binding CsgD family transcriptional regulator